MLIIKNRFARPDRIRRTSVVAMPPAAGQQPAGGAGSFTAALAAPARPVPGNVSSAGFQRLWQLHPLAAPISSPRGAARRAIRSFIQLTMPPANLHAGADTTRISRRSSRSNGRARAISLDRQFSGRDQFRDGTGGHSGRRRPNRPATTTPGTGRGGRPTIPGRRSQELRPGDRRDVVILTPGLAVIRRDYSASNYSPPPRSRATT